MRIIFTPIYTQYTQWTDENMNTKRIKQWGCRFNFAIIVCLLFQQIMLRLSMVTGHVLVMINMSAMSHVNLFSL